MKFDRKIITKFLIAKIAIIVFLFVLFLPIIPIETQIQCITAPCNPIIEKKSIFTILFES